MPRFVVLEHHWNGVHWDLMLEPEEGGSLQTWAIDARPAPGVDLPARRLPDHRAAYLDYEGPISGDRGHVTRFDAGTYAIRSRATGRLELEFSGNQLRGTAVLTTGTALGAYEKIVPYGVFRFGKVD